MREPERPKSDDTRRSFSWAPKVRPPQGSAWTAALDGDDLVITTATTVRLPLVDLTDIRARLGLVTSRVEITGIPPLSGLSRRDARDLRDTLLRERDRVIASRRLASLIIEFDELATEAREWAVSFIAAAKSHQAWLPREFTQHWNDTKPPARLGELLANTELDEHRQNLDGAALVAMDLWSADLHDYVARWNDNYLTTELTTNRSFFDNVESSPLTDEQARAVVCFDNRVQLIASAGSGKTSTMIAKAGYAAYRGLVSPQHILMLAFNSKAATELRQRVDARLTPLGIEADRIVASTFHAFGLSVIGQATGRKPSLASWAEPGRDIEKLAQIVDHLRDTNPGFRTEWDLFRYVFRADLPAFGEEANEPDAWDPITRTDGFRTLGGEIVRSQGERLIADWLYFNGVEYVYEGRYEVDTVDTEHGHYRPDFYYPAISTYHEHFALDRDGIPPAEFVGYLDGVHWKRDVHAANNTTLIETTMAELWDGSAFSKLAAELTSRGIELRPNPERPAVGQPPIDNERLIGTVRAFMVHAKSNQLTVEQLLERASAGDTGRFRFRHAMFVRLYAAIRAGWDAALRADDSIDFEDMLTLAADHIEAGNWQSPYRLVMVDEMQDASFARARLARALTAAPDRYLFTVGDDWQSINRFAGADLSVMTGFDDWFGPGETLRLERTFRCPQSLCDISSTFVAKNPAQLRKRVVSSTEEHPPSVVAIAAKSDDGVAGAIRRHLAELNDRIARGDTAPGRDGTTTVYILGRYRHQASLLPPARDYSHLTVTFSTIHASKGLEADYVVIPGMTRDKAAFPSRAADDPVLRLAMPTGESYPHAEERRLFYVALTRARRAVTLVTVANRESAFLLELVNEQGVPLRASGGGAIHVVHCTSCADGVMVPRKGKFGQFLGCSNFPRCTQTMKVASA